MLIDAKYTRALGDLTLEKPYKPPTPKGITLDQIAPSAEIVVAIKSEDGPRSTHW